MSKDVKTYSFLPREESQMQKEDILIQSGLLLKYRSVERTLTVNIEEISLSLNTEIAKDFMNILNPVLAYKKLSESFNLQSALIEMNAMP